MIWKSRRMKTKSIALRWHGSKEPSIGSTMAPTESANSPASRFRRGGSKQCHTRRRSSMNRCPSRPSDHRVEPRSIRQRGLIRQALAGISVREVMTPNPVQAPDRGGRCDWSTDQDGVTVHVSEIVRPVISGRFALRKLRPTMLSVARPANHSGDGRLFELRGALLRVLRLAIAKRPVLLLHLHEADEGVLATKPHCFVESVGQCPIEGSLDVDASSLIECHLDQDRFLAPPNAEIGGVDYEFAL